MELSVIKKLTNLNELTGKHFTSLSPDKYKKEVYTASFGVVGYKDLIFVVSDLIKLCIKAIEAEESHDPGLIVSPLVNISNILEIAIQLLPIDEAELLDQLLALMEKPQT
jgi:hypothetical protein